MATLPKSDTPRLILSKAWIKPFSKRPLTVSLTVCTRVSSFLTSLRLSTATCSWTSSLSQISTISVRPILPSLWSRSNSSRYCSYSLPTLAMARSSFDRAMSFNCSNFSVSAWASLSRLSVSSWASLSRSSASRCEVSARRSDSTWAAALRCFSTRFKRSVLRCSIAASRIKSSPANWRCLAACCKIKASLRA